VRRSTGAFGKVDAVVHLSTGCMLARKSMSRQVIKGKKAQSVVVNEFKFLKMLGERPSLFTTLLRYVVHCGDEIQLFMPLLSGGDLSYHLRMARKFSGDRPVFHAAQIALGLDHMHSLRLIHRDIKPANIQLDEFGNCRVSDLGLAAEAHATLPPGLTRGRAGTPGAPPPRAPRAPHLALL